MNYLKEDTLLHNLNIKYSDSNNITLVELHNSIII
jgi:hypothetical protein